MKLFKLFLFLILNTSLAKKVSEGNHLISKALQDVIRQLYIEPKIDFETIIYGNVSLQVYDIVDKVFKSGLITHIKRLKKYRYGALSNSTIIFCESLKDAKYFLNNGLGGDSFATHYRFLFYIHQTFNDTKKGVHNISWDYGRTSWFSYFISKHIDEIKLQTIKWFTEFKCDEEQLVTLNSYDLKLKKWTKQLENLYSYYNYHGCTLRVDTQIFRIYIIDNFFNEWSMFLPLFPTHLLQIMTEVSEKRDKIEADFIQILVQQGNFTISKDTSILQRHMYIFTTTWNYMKYTHFSSEFFQEDYTAMTTPAEAYTSYEKLVLPFDITTWIFLLVTFAIAFVVIFVSGKLQKPMLYLVQK